MAGNKFRKLYALLQTPSSRYKELISYGGSQSNAMLSLAYVCKQKKWKFTYYTKPVAQRIQEQSYGNLYESKKLGMEHIEVEHDLYRETIERLRFNLHQDVLVLDQGGADKLAKEGVALLAKEIVESNLNSKKVALPSGTGTTALYLALSLPLEYTVYTVACIGDSEYLKEQMKALHPLPKNLVILQASKKYHFAKPYREFFQTYKKLLESGIEFDLLYAPLLWKTLLEQNIENVMYIHSGGVSGNKSMITRYKAKGLSI